MTIADCLVLLVKIALMVGGGAAVVVVLVFLGGHISKRHREKMQWTQLEQAAMTEEAQSPKTDNPYTQRFDGQE